MEPAASRQHSPLAGTLQGVPCTATDEQAGNRTSTQWCHRACQVTGYPASSAAGAAITSRCSRPLASCSSFEAAARLCAQRLRVPVIEPGAPQHARPQAQSCTALPAEGLSHLQYNGQAGGSTRCGPIRHTISMVLLQLFHNRH